VQVRRCRLGVPEQLRVVVGVGVDEAGRDDLAGRVDDLGRVLGDVADGDDAAVTNADVGAPRGRAGAVDHRAAADHDVEHAAPPQNENAFYSRRPSVALTTRAR
jgi:hypothetical protein